MGLFTSERLDSFETLFNEKLMHLYDVEQRLIKALPKMADAAQNNNLRIAFQEHLRQTQEQARRLEQIFQLLGRNAESKTCEAMKGLIDDGQEVIDATGDACVKDAALIAAGQCVEHYEISAYGTARTWAQRLGNQQIVQLLQQTLDEESATDRKLTMLAEQGINARAEATTR